MVGQTVQNFTQAARNTVTSIASTAGNVVQNTTSSITSLLSSPALLMGELLS